MYGLLCKLREEALGLIFVKPYLFADESSSQLGKSLYNLILLIDLSDRAILDLPGRGGGGEWEGGDGDED